MCKTNHDTQLEQENGTLAGTVPRSQVAAGLGASLGLNVGFAVGAYLLVLIQLVVNRRKGSRVCSDLHTIQLCPHFFSDFSTISVKSNDR
jgi:hypothetical protein